MMYEIQDIIKCHVCENRMIRVAHMQRMTFQGQSQDFLMPGFYCETCPAGVVIGKDMQTSDAVLHELKRRAQAAAESEAAA